jgi:hypothetical protein
MLENGDIENVEELVLKADYGHLPDSWLRIKRLLIELTQQTHNKQSAPLCVSCHRVDKCERVATECGGVVK